MFGFTHPRPPSRKEVAMQIVQQAARAFNATTLTVDLPDDPVVAPPPEDTLLRFEVACTAGEYRSFLRDHLAFLIRHESAHKRRTLWAWPLAIASAAFLLGRVAGPGWLGGLSMTACALALACLPVFLGLWVVLVGTPMFYMKKRRMPVCAFHIDAAGIARATRDGELVRRWDEVKAVRRYRRGYLVIMADGAMPIPLRCLTAAQQERLRAFFIGRPGCSPPAAQAALSGWRCRAAPPIDHRLF
jgi:hypothetical protein